VSWLGLLGRVPPVLPTAGMRRGWRWRHEYCAGWIWTWCTCSSRRRSLAAVILAETGQAITYIELDRGSTRLARYFYAAGLRRGDVVVLVAENTPIVFEVYWAAQRSGLYLAALNHHLSPAELAYIVNDCGAKAVVMSAAKSGAAAVLKEQCEGLTVRLAFGGDIEGYDDYGTVPDEYSRSAPRGWSSNGSSDTAFNTHEVQRRDGALVGADGVQGARDRDVVGVVACRLRPRPVLSPSGHTTVDEAGIAGETLIRAEAEALGHAGPPSLNEHVSRLEETE